MSRDDWLWLFGGVVLILAIGFGLMTVWSLPVRAASLGCGIASHYGRESGTRTATGERFPTSEATAAMPSRSMLGKYVTVRNVQNGRIVRVRINDLGPAARLHRIIDLSPAAKLALGMGGLAKVCLSIEGR